MNDINKWFYSLTLNELQEYIIKLEYENERLVKELNTSSKMNTLLENIVKSTQTGYSLLRRIEINKNCECNEHRNSELRKALNQSISETNLLLNHLHQFLSLKDSDNSGHDSDKDEIVDITDESNDSPVPLSIRHTAEDKESSVSNNSTISSGYDSMEFITTGVPVPDRPIMDRVVESGYHSEYTPIESQPSIKQREEMPQNLSKPKSPQFSPIRSPLAVEHNSNSPSATSATSMTLTPSLENMNKNLPNKCSECDLSFNLKPSLDQHLLTHINTTFTVQRAGRGRPAKNDPRVLRVTDSDLNILRMNETMAGLPDGVISLSALEELRRAKFTGFGRYRCPWPDCGYTPHFLRDLRRHMFKHTGDKKYKCDLDGCDFITVWKTSLLQHQRKKHNVTDPANRTSSHTSNNTNKTNNNTNKNNNNLTPTMTSATTNDTNIANNNMIVSTIETNEMSNNATKIN